MVIDVFTCVWVCLNAVSGLFKFAHWSKVSKQPGEFADFLCVDVLRIRISESGGGQSLLTSGSKCYIKALWSRLRCFGSLTCYREATVVLGCEEFSNLRVAIPILEQRLDCQWYILDDYSGLTDFKLFGIFAVLLDPAAEPIDFMPLEIMDSFQASMRAVAKSLCAQECLLARIE